MHKDVERLKRRRKQLEEAVTRITTQLRDEPRNHEYKDKLAEYAAKIDALDRLYAGKIITLNAQFRLIELDLEEFPKQQREILKLRYIDGLPWKRVARVAKYSENHVFKIFEAAVRKMDSK